MFLELHQRSAVEAHWVFPPWEAFMLMPSSVKALVDRATIGRARGQRLTFVQRPPSLRADAQSPWPPRVGPMPPGAGRERMSH